MKKKVALLLAGVMTVGMIPMSAFASTTNRMSNVVTGEEDKEVAKITSSVPVLKMYEKDLNDIAKEDATSKQAFQLDLTNAEWTDDAITGALKSGIKGMKDIKITKLSSKSIIVEGGVEPAKGTDDAYISVPMLTKLKTNGDATVTIDPMDSVVSAGTYKFATVADSSATVTVEKKKDVPENGAQLKSIVIKEASAGAIEKGTLKLKLSSDWSYKSLTKDNISVYPEGSVTIGDITLKDEDAEIEITDVKTSAAKTITITPEVKYDEDEVDAGDICEMTVSGAGVDKTTLEVATAVTYGVTWEAEDKTLPVFYSGSMDPDQDSLQVTMEESVTASWLTNRKSKIVFPEGVRVLGVEISDANGQFSGETNSGVKAQTGKFEINNDGNELTFKDWQTKGTDTAKVKFKFQLSIAPSFTGDITATITGKGVDEDITAVIGTAVAPVTVEAVSTDAIIDYRHTAIGDITITEAEAGVLGKDKTLGVKVENLEFDDDPTVEVVSGDLKIDTVKVDGGVIKIKIKSESAKTPAVIKITNCELLMDRTIPAGSYALKLTATDTWSDSQKKDDKTVDTAVWDGDSFDVDGDDKSDAIFQNSIKDGDDYDKTPFFDSRNVTVVKDYVNVVTAGRDQDDSTFTTTLKVTIGGNEMYANDKAIALDVPAYISNGYTMLPVRAVTEALSGSAIVRWDDATKTVTITFGSRVINMTVGSNVMVINGVNVAMQAKCEITDSRAFIPLRDMGYALGLNDDKIKWDDATKTATLN